MLIRRNIWINNIIFVIVNSYLRLLVTGNDVSDIAYHRHSDVTCDLALVQHNICRIKQLKRRSITTNSTAITNNRFNEKLRQIHSDIEEISKSIAKVTWKKRNSCVSGSYGVFGYPITLNYPVQRMVKFDEPFEDKPVINYGITKIDASRTDFLWLLVSIEHITRTGFDIIFNEYRDTVLYGINITWMACPTVK